MAALLTLRQDGRRHDIIMSDGMLNRFVNVHSAYAAMAAALQWILDNPAADRAAVAGVAESALLTMDGATGARVEVPFHA